MKQIIKKIYLTRAGSIVLSPVAWLFNIFRYHLVPDDKFVESQFKKKLGYLLDLNNPQTFNEKLQWLKLNYRKPEMTIAADKWEVRKMVKERVGEKYLIPTWGIFDDYQTIEKDSLPASFALKATHGSGWNIICHDKSELDFKGLKKKLKEWQGTNYYLLGKEWVYKDIKPRFICEKLVLDESGKSPKDYKFFCFNGKPEYVQVDLDRFEDHQRAFYNTDWEKQSFGILYPSSKVEVEKPMNFEEMIQTVERLAEGFPFVRVDLYNLNGKIYFGELTFFPGNGTETFYPDKWDKKLGNLIQLPYDSKS